MRFRLGLGIVAVVFTSACAGNRPICAVPIRDGLVELCIAAIERSNDKDEIDALQKSCQSFIEVRKEVCK